MYSFSNTQLYPCSAVSQFSRRMLLLTRVISRSIVVFEISVFRSNINSNSAFGDLFVCRQVSHNVVNLDVFRFFSVGAVLVYVNY